MLARPCRARYVIGGMLEALLYVLRSHDASLVVRACAVLCAADTSGCRDGTLRCEGAVVDAMHAHPCDSAVAYHGVLALRALAPSFVSGNGLRLAFKTCEAMPLVRGAAAAIASAAVRSPELRAEAVALAEHVGEECVRAVEDALRALHAQADSAAAALIAEEEREQAARVARARRSAQRSARRRAARKPQPEPADASLPASLPANLPANLPEYLRPSPMFLKLASLHAEVETLKKLVGRSDACVVCLSSPHTHAALPCGHLCLCEWCAQSLVRHACPMCQQNTSAFVRIHIVECD